MKKFLLIIGLAALFLGASEGLRIVEIEKMQKENALLQQNTADWENEQIIFLYPDGSEITVLSFKDLGLKIILDDDNNLKLCYDQEDLEQKLKVLINPPLKEAKNSYFVISYDNKITIIPEEHGQSLDCKQMRKDLERNIRLHGPISVAVTYQEHDPEVTEEDLLKLGIDEFLAEYKTEFDSSNQARAANIWLASSNFAEYILLPGEVLSFNEIVGERTAERGYQKAGVLVNAQYDIDYGGGVCQVSSTLYNAARLANLTILERHSHSHQVSYVPKGRDAAVVYGEKDLKIRNDRNEAVLIKGYFALGSISFKIFG